MIDNKDNKNSQKIARLEKVIESTGFNQKKFAEVIGYKPSYISEMLSGTKGVPKPMARRLNEALGIDIEWFNTGSGFMTEAISDQYQSGELTIREAIRREQLSEPGVHKVPMYDGDVTASIVSSFDDVREAPSYYVDFKPFNDCTALFRVYGDSMYPKYASGEIVAVKQVFNMNTLLWGEAYLVVTNAESDNLRTIKTVHPSDDPDSIVLKASNPNFRGDTVIPKRSIIAMFLVKGKTRIEHL